MNKLATYQKLNRSFRKKYFFNFGSEGGFYSEFNNMIFGIIYCLAHKYRFIMYSGNSQFKIHDGWDDFFEPFADTVNSSFHKKFNRRLTAKKMKLRNYPQWYLFKLFNNNSFLTYELFYSFCNNDFYREHFDFPELGLKGNVRQLSGEFIKMIYRFNAPTKAAVQTIITELNMPEKYAAMHVRKGDKDMEHDLIPTNIYLKKLRELSDLKDVFVFTDDYTAIEDLQAAAPDIRFYTTVNQDERGYIHTNFMKMGPEDKKRDLIKMFASLEVMKAAEIALGAYTTNPGLFLSMTMPEEKFVNMQGILW